MNDLGAEVAADYGDPQVEYAALNKGVAMVDRNARGSISVTGPDALRFLQSLFSQDVEQVANGEGVHTLLLQPQGKLDVDLRLLRIGEEEILLDCEIGQGERLTASLRRFLIRMRAEVADQSEATGCIAVRGPTALTTIESIFAVHVPATQHHHIPTADGLHIVRSDWPAPLGTLGVDLFGPRELLSSAWEQLQREGVQPAGLLAYEAARITAGVMRQGHDLDERTIPQEAELERDTVSFTKGCFLGQELVCRIDTRGHVNRYLRMLQIHDQPGTPATPMPGAAIVSIDGKNVGEMRSIASTAVLNPSTALGYVRHEVEVGQEVEIRWENDVAKATVSARPAATTVI